jgi:hypothetical protein
MSPGIMRDAAQMPELDEETLLELAHLWCSWRLARGATHALNNALTVASGLADLSESAGDLRRQLDRCIGITRSLTDHHPVRLGHQDEGELSGLMRGIAALLRVNLSRSFELEVELADEFFPLEHDPARIELLLLCILLCAVGQSERGGHLRLSLETGPKPATASVGIELLATDVSAGAADTLLDPDSAPSAGQALALEAVRRVAARCDAALAARRLDGGLGVRILFPVAEV